MNILWIYYCPLIPEAECTERMTALIAKGLTADGHNCLGMLVINQDGSASYNNEPVDDIYSFLKLHAVDVVINQLAMDTWLLEIFLAKGGRQWKKEGGKLISRLHFDSRQTSALYYFQNKRHKTLKDYYWIAKSRLLFKHYDKLQAEKAGKAYRWIYDNSDWYITLSESHNPYFKRVVGLNSYDKLRTINNPLTFDSIAAPEIIRHKKKVVLICARMDEYQKRISLALKAWERLQKHSIAGEWTLKIVGTGPDLEEYQELVAQKNIRNIQFCGRGDSEPYYDEASIFLMTSGYEGWGLTLTESLQKGVVPVVMNTSPVFEDIITNGYNGFLTRDSRIGDFVKHVLILMEDRRRLEAMQQNALNSASGFTLASTMQKWREIIPPALS